MHIFKLQIHTAMSWSTYAQLKRPRQQVVVGITSSLVGAVLLGSHAIARDKTYFVHNVEDFWAVC